MRTTAFGGAAAAMLRGLRRQLQADQKIGLSPLEAGYTGHEEIEYSEEDVEQFYDDISGALLPAKEVRAARLEEIEYLQTFPVYKKVPAAMAKGKEKSKHVGVISTKGTWRPWH